MGSPDPVREDVIMLMSRNFGADVAKFFSHASEEDTTSIFLHHSFQLLKELMGEEKARVEMNAILKKHAVVQTYE